ncbi:MAG: hypothetical protein ACJATI_004118 [Halioglobus sp.]|jgi:hypothetical protein
MEYNSADEVFYTNDRIFALIGHFCGSLECCSLVELSEQGDTLFRTVIPDVDAGFKAMIVSNDTIIVIGNNDEFNTHARTAHFDFEGNKLGETLEVFILPRITQMLFN